MPNAHVNHDLRGKPSAGWRILALLMVALIAVAGLIFWLTSTGALPSHDLAGFWHRDTHTDISTVIERIQQLERLETIVYTTDQVVEGNRESLILPGFLAGDRLLLIAHGEVIAGVDLGQVTAGNIHTSGNSVQVNLPEPQIFAASLDNSRTRVYSRTTGLLVSGDPSLETEVRAKAEQQIRAAALADGILQKARENARVTVKSLLSGVGFEKVEVN